MKTSRRRKTRKIRVSFCKRGSGVRQKYNVIQRLKHHLRLMLHVKDGTNNKHNTIK